ncbi:MAG: rRNA ((527)-N(7))-methyltransferase RsmG [Bacteroidota bacterium]
MVGPEIITSYFTFSEKQLSQIQQLFDLYSFHNARVNVISRKDMDNFYIHHVLHGLAMSTYCRFAKGEEFLDIGTGGGFPGIPLAIACPETQFTLCDSIGKKIQVVKAIAEELGLKNVEAIQSRTEQLNRKFDGATARAVAPAKSLMEWMKGQFKGAPRMYLLKGGDLDQEAHDLMQLAPSSPLRIQDLSELYPNLEFFETKKLMILGQN